jgi:hypothetical protein
MAAKYYRNQLDRREHYSHVQNHAEYLRRYAGVATSVDESGNFLERNFHYLHIIYKMIGHTMMKERDIGTYIPLTLYPRKINHIPLRAVAEASQIFFRDTHILRK